MTEILLSSGGARFGTLALGLALFAVCAVYSISPLVPWMGFAIAGMVVGMAEVMAALGDFIVTSRSVENGRRILSLDHFIDECFRLAKQVVVFVVGAYVLEQTQGHSAATPWTVLTAGLCLLPLLVLCNQIGGMYLRVRLNQLVGD